MEPEPCIDSNPCSDRHIFVPESKSQDQTKHEAGKYSFWSRVKVTELESMPGSMSKILSYETGIYEKSDPESMFPRQGTGINIGCDPETENHERVTSIQNRETYRRSETD